MLIKSYIALLKNLGIKRLGSGYCSVVYQHPTIPSVAVKLFTCPDHKSMEWLRLSRKHAAENPWLPVIHDIVPVPFHSTAVPTRYQRDDIAELTYDRMAYIVFMEKLKPSTIRQRQAAAEKVIDTLPPALTKKVKTKHDGAGLDHLEDFRIMRQSRDPLVKQLATLLMRVDANDIHCNNIMARGTQLVYTDPVVSDDTTSDP